MWVKNVVAIGLSAGFIEPLEGNGLFSVHEFLRVLIRNLKRDQIIYVGNDLNDMSIFNSDIFCCCPSDSAEEIKQLANYISQKEGGNGAVRDICESFFNFSLYKEKLK